ncbi:MFS transporter permease [Teredinibacter sp. KSP-S5-2]|uniref:MFS transporter permease n=1 Tax=Teredinibacter sp. KSP-S5-2 TaxID=3034506 RepID=UPI002935041C|nr:MFS transporter permease [Teredinibacter sp. KSP-S5-2]WNO09642.1 MFS transporter permease [Teredinibacter sp. KSP-S5-2]
MNYYTNRRVIAVFLLGISSGFPWVIIGSALTLWLKEAGLSRADIGYAALIFSVYAINFLWSPLVDRIGFTRMTAFVSKIGIQLDSRRVWVAICQLAIAIGCILMSMHSPEINAKSLVLIGLFVATASATQDIAVDAYRVDSFDRSEPQLISAAAGAATAGWWSGYAGLGFLPLFLSDQNWSWPQLYIAMAGIVALLFSLTIFLPVVRFTGTQEQGKIFDEFKTSVLSTHARHKYLLLTLASLPFVVVIWSLAGAPGIPQSIQQHSAFIPILIVCVLTLLALTTWRCQNLLTNQTQSNYPSRLDTPLAWFLTAVAGPLRDFFQRNGYRFAISMLCFIFIFKIGEAFLGRMSIVFYKEIGYSNTEIATYSKMLTWWLTIIFAITGGWINGKFGLYRGLFVSGIAMAASNLMFSWIAEVGPSIPLYIAAIVVDGFAQAWSTVAFVSLVSLMCNHSFSATQYALMASLGNFGRTTLSATSGQVVDWLNGNWSLFFIITSLMVIPGLTILWRLKAPIENLLKQQPTQT